MTQRGTGGGDAELGDDRPLPDGGTDPAHRHEQETAGPFELVPGPLLRPPTAGIALVTAAYLAVFVSVTDVVGGTDRLLAAVALALLAGAILARLLAVRGALLLTGGILSVGLVWYYFAVPESYREMITVTAVLFDTISMLTGLSVLRLVALDVWAVALAPVPTFLAWYLAARGRYVGSALVAGTVLGFFVLTGDAGTATTLLGVVGIALAVALDTVSVPGGLDAHVDTLAVVIAAMILLSVTLSVVPGGAAQPWTTDRGDPGLESSLVGTQDSVQIVGPIDLSPEVRFTVESTHAANWHTASYDRYTGDGWVRTGDATPYEGELASPAGSTVRVEQTVTVRADMQALPSAWKAVTVEGAPVRNAQVSERGGLQPGATIREGETFTVHSEVVQAPPETLRAAPEEYPAEIEERYTQLPDSTPDRVGALTEEVIESADADTDYDRAVAVERYLQESKEYSLSVQQPDGDVADEFLFEMEAGYCTYFATAMVAMLRSQGIPAKFVTGYSTGERVGQDEWVVRGQDAHAWVMVYVPEHGWVEFDPTPSSDRSEVRERTLEEAREDGAEDVDVDDTGEEWTPDPDDHEDRDDGDHDTAREGAELEGPGGEDFEGLDPGAGEVGDPAEVEDPDDWESLDAVNESAIGEEDRNEGPLSDRGTLGYTFLVLLGIVAGARYTGAPNRAYRAVWLRFQRRHDPVTDSVRAFARLEHLLARRYRERRPGETPREYLDAMDDRGADSRIHRIGDAYEQARYAGDVSPEDADEAVRTVTRLAFESTPVARRLLRQRTPDDNRSGP